MRMMDMSNWLGFSLSPNHHHQQHGHSNPDHHIAGGEPSREDPSCGCEGSSFASAAAGGCGDDGVAFGEPLPVMPLRSDGSVCVMDTFPSNPGGSGGGNRNPCILTFRRGLHIFLFSGRFLIDAAANLIHDLSTSIDCSSLPFYPLLFLPHKPLRLKWS